MGGTEELRALLALLERILVKRQALIDRLDGVVAGATPLSEQEARVLHERLARLVQEQQRLLGLLAALVPPDGAAPEAGLGPTGGGRLNDLVA